MYVIRNNTPVSLAIVWGFISWTPFLDEVNYGRLPTDVVASPALLQRHAPANKAPPLRRPEHRDRFSALWPLVRSITVSSALSRRRFGGAGGFPCRVRVPRLARAVRRRARSPARPARAPAAPPRTARARTGAAPPRRVQGALRLRVGRPPSAAGRRRETLRCRTAGRRAYTLRTPPADKAPGGRRGSSRRETPDL